MRGVTSVHARIGQHPPMVMIAAISASPSFARRVGILPLVLIACGLGLLIYEIALVVQMIGR